MAATDFLAQRRIAVAGVSASRELPGSNIYKRFKDRGYQVFAVNPHAERVHGEPCYPDLKSIPGGVDGVVIVTRPEVTESIVRQCPEAGVSRVWIHRSMVHGSSASAAATAFCREHGISVIDGACPLMFGKTSDLGHECMRFFMGITGSLPRDVPIGVPAHAQRESSTRPAPLT
jgi:predicted CoA-binding protein